MRGFGPETFGALHAADYDARYGPVAPEAVVEAIAGIVEGGSILELGVGTGRVALPQAERGLRVSGIEASPEMVAQLRAKPGGEAIPVAVGDFSHVDVEGTFDHVLLLINTLFCLPSQNDQVRCFENVAEHLNGGGTFLIEAFVPDLSRFAQGQAVRTEHFDRDSVTLQAACHDPVRQRIDIQEIHLTEQGVRLRPLPLRYAWPWEIDLMARLAGLDLEVRWGGWDRSAFTAESRMHVSLYRKKPVV